MNVFLQLTVTGLAMGMIYALVAMGLILLIRAVGVMNFAQGDLLMMGAFITYGLTYQINLPIYLMIPISIIMFALIGVIFMYCVYWPLRNASYPAAKIIATMVASIVIREICSLIWGSVPIVTSSIIPGTLRIGSLTLQYQYLLIAALVLLLAEFLILDRRNPLLAHLNIFREKQDSKNPL